MENNPLFNLLDCMELYVLHETKGSAEKGLAYYPTCGKVGKIGSLDHFTIRGCREEIFTIQPKKGTCSNCDYRGAIKILEKDILPLYKEYKTDAPLILISGIERGLEEMSYPSIHSPQLIEAQREWNKLDLIEKRVYVLELKNYLENLKKLEEDVEQPKKTKKRKKKSEIELSA